MPGLVPFSDQTLLTVEGVWVYGDFIIDHPFHFIDFIHGRLQCAGPRQEVFSFQNQPIRQSA